MDGQQRVTSLYAIRKGIRLTKDGKEIDYKDIFIDLGYDAEADEQVVVAEKQEGRRYVAVHDVLTKPLGNFYKELPHDLADLIEKYKNKLTSYDFSSITIKDYPIEIACEVFSRINTGGKSLTVFEIMVAKTYDESKKFDLALEYEVLRDGADDEKECLKGANFETLPESIAMQCVAAISLGAVRSRDILKIKRESFIANWVPMKAALFSAIDFLRTELRVPVSQLLPYPALVVPLTYFFHTIKNKKVSSNQKRLLEQYFYWVGVTERFSSATESKLAEDINRMIHIAKEIPPAYPSEELTVRSKKIAETWFSAGNAYCKSILCLLAYHEPKSFDTNGLVILDNSNLKIASSRNYHHFFPKAYLADKQPDQEANLIANITLIDGYGNKHRIGKKAPATYIKKFAVENKKLGASLESHLISDPEDFGIYANDYVTFIDKRSTALAKALNKKLKAVN